MRVLRRDEQQAVQLPLLRLWRRPFANPQTPLHPPAGSVSSRYCGEFVVPYERKIVAHGMDAAAVLAETAPESLDGRPRSCRWSVYPLLDIPPRCAS